MIDQKTKNMRLIGITLFIVSTVVAISMAAKMPEANADYPTTTIGVITALIFGIIGNILWHKTEKSSVLAELEVHKNDDKHNPVIILTQTIPVLEKLNADFDTFKDLELCEEIDSIMDQYIHPFTEKRKTFMDILGQSNGAQVLLIIAYAERMLNRTWSAMSDGYPGEAKNSLEDSIQNYKKALEQTNQYL